MSSRPRVQERVNPRTGITHSEMKDFVRNHFEEFVKRKTRSIGQANFARNLWTTARMCRRDPSERGNMLAARIRKLPDNHLEILDLISEDDRVVGRNHWMGGKASGNDYEFSEIVIARRQLVER